MWLHAGRDVSAQFTCPVPPSKGDIGSVNDGRWESFQNVTVKLYPGHFTTEEQTEIRNVLDEFESAGASQNCSQMQFVSMEEEFFSISNSGIGDPSDIDTLYIYRRPISEMPTDSGGSGGSASLAFNQYKWQRVWIKLREDVTVLASKAVFKSTLRHEVGHSFWLADAYSSPCSVTMMCSQFISITQGITACDNYKLSTLYCQIAATPSPSPTPGTCNAAPNYDSFTSGCMTGFVYNGSTCGRSGAFITKCDTFEGYDESSCNCHGCLSCGGSPVLVDVAGDGFALTAASGGVPFDLDGDGAGDHFVDFGGIG